MSAPTLEALAAEARQLITDGRFLEARKVVLAYCNMLANDQGNDASVQEAREFLSWAMKAVVAMRSHALLRRSELNRAVPYASSSRRRARKTWEIVS
jgi:hypothetical protein